MQNIVYKYTQKELQDDRNRKKTTRSDEDTGSGDRFQNAPI